MHTCLDVPPFSNSKAKVLKKPFFLDYVHENSSTLALLQTAKCTPMEIFPSRYIAICARCDSNCQNSITLASFGQKLTVACRACHTALSLCVPKCSLVRVGGLASDWLQADEQAILKLQRRNIQEKSHNKVAFGQVNMSSTTNVPLIILHAFLTLAVLGFTKYRHL